MKKIWERADLRNRGVDDHIPFDADLRSGNMNQRRHLPIYRAGEVNKVVRGITYKDDEGQIIDAKQLNELAAAAKKEFAILSDEFGIAVSPTEIVIGEDAGHDPNIFSVSDVIDGQNLEQIADEGLRNNSREEWKNLIGQLNKTAIGLFDYFCAKAESGGCFLTDLNYYLQYVYGKGKGEASSRLYLVDTDTLMAGFEKNDGMNRVYLSVKLLDVFKSFIKTAERTLSDSQRRVIELTEARRHIYDRVRQPAPAGYEDAFEKLKDEIVF